MSLKKLALMSAAGLTMGILGSLFFQSLPSRNLASEARPTKTRFKGWAHSLHGKTKQSIQVVVAAVGGIPNNDQQEIRLRAKVVLNRPIDQEVRYQWSLPEGASLVSGELDDAWANLQPGQVATTEITVIGVSKESVAKTVTLHVSGSANGVQYASSGSFATNSPEQMSADDSTKQMKLQDEELVLKKTKSAEKMDKLHQ